MADSFQEVVEIFGGDVEKARSYWSTIMTGRARTGPLADPGGVVGQEAWTRTNASERGSRGRIGEILDRRVLAGLANRRAAAEPEFNTSLTGTTDYVEDPYDVQFPVGRAEEEWIRTEPLVLGNERAVRSDLPLRVGTTTNDVLAPLAQRAENMPWRVEDTGENPYLAPLAQPQIERPLSVVEGGGNIEAETIEKPEIKTKITTDAEGNRATEEIITEPAKIIKQQPARDPSITSFSIMQKYDEWEKEFLQQLKAKADSRRKKDFWFGTNTADSTWQNGLAFLKTMRAGAQSQANYLQEQELMQGLFDTDNPIREAANRGANLDQLGKVSEIVADMSSNPDAVGEKIKQAIFAAEGWYDTMSDTSKQVELDKYGTRDNAIKNYAADLITNWNSKALTESTTNVSLNQGMETEYQKSAGKALAAAPIEVYTDQNNKYSNAQADLDRINLAIALLENGKIQTGPLTQPWLSTMRMVNQAFGGGGQSQTLQIQDARKKSLFRNPDNRELADYEFFSSLSTLLGARLIQLTKGNVTEREMMMFLRIAPELGKTPDGNLILLKILKNMNQKIVDWDLSARRYMAENGFPKDGAEWITWMRKQPEVTKWLGDEDGLGGIIEREWYELATKDKEPIGGIPEGSGFSIIGEGEKGNWGTDEPMPFGVVGNDGRLRYYIVKEGLLYEVRVTQ